MARIIPIQPRITVQQTADAYPVCIFSNDTFMTMFETSLIVSKDLIDQSNIEHSTIESILTGISEYRVWKANKVRTEPQLPTEITEHFALLPETECNIEMLFEADNNIPTEAIFYSYKEIRNIIDAYTIALKNADAEQSEVILPLHDSFSTFLNDWEATQQMTGSYFANEQKI